MLAIDAATLGANTTAAIAIAIVGTIYQSELLLKLAAALHISMYTSLLYYLAYFDSFVVLFCVFSYNDTNDVGKAKVWPK